MSQSGNVADPDPMQDGDPWARDEAEDEQQESDQYSSISRSSGSNRWTRYRPGVAEMPGPPPGYERAPPPRGRGRSFNAPTIGTSTGIEPGLDMAPPSRIVHDVPPVWDGKDPVKMLEPYVKVLKGWLATTRTLKSQQGMVIMQYATGDLRVIINELDIEDLTADDGGQAVLKHIEKKLY